MSKIKLVELKNGKFVVAELSLIGNISKAYDKECHCWDRNEHILKYCLFDTIEEAEKVYHRMTAKLSINQIIK